MGIKINLNEINVSKAIEIRINSNRVGELRSGVFSPTFNQVIGIVMIDKPYFKLDTKVELTINNEIKSGILCNIPFV